MFPSRPTGPQQPGHHVFEQGMQQGVPFHPQSGNFRPVQYQVPTYGPVLASAASYGRGLGLPATSPFVGSSVGMSVVPQQPGVGMPQYAWPQQGIPRVQGLSCGPAQYPSFYPMMTAVPCPPNAPVQALGSLRPESKQQHNMDEHELTRQRHFFEQQHRLKAFHPGQGTRSAEDFIKSMMGTVPEKKETKKEPGIQESPEQAIPSESNDSFGDFVSSGSSSELPSMMPAGGSCTQTSQVAPVGGMQEMPQVTASHEQKKEVPAGPKLEDLMERFSDLSHPSKGMDFHKKKAVRDLEVGHKAQVSHTFQASGKAVNWSHLPDVQGMFTLRSQSDRPLEGSDVVLPRWLIDPTAQRPEFKYWLSVVMGENGHLDVGKVFALLSSSGLSREGLERIWNAAREDAIPGSPLTPLQFMTTLAMIAIVQGGGEVPSMLSLRKLSNCPIPWLNIQRSQPSPLGGTQPPPSPLAAQSSPPTAAQPTQTIPPPVQTTQLPPVQMGQFPVQVIQPPPTQVNQLPPILMKHPPLSAGAQVQSTSDQDEDEWSDFTSAPVDHTTPSVSAYMTKLHMGGEVGSKSQSQDTVSLMSSETRSASQPQSKDSTDDFGDFESAQSSSIPPKQGMSSQDKYSALRELEECLEDIEREVGPSSQKTQPPDLLKWDLLEGSDVVDTTETKFTPDFSAFLTAEAPKGSETHASHTKVPSPPEIFEWDMGASNQDWGDFQQGSSETPSGAPAIAEKTQDDFADFLAPRTPKATDETVSLASLELATMNLDGGSRHGSTPSLDLKMYARDESPASIDDPTWHVTQVPQDEVKGLVFNVAPLLGSDKYSSFRDLDSESAGQSSCTSEKMRVHEKSIVDTWGSLLPFFKKANADVRPEDVAHPPPNALGDSPDNACGICLLSTEHEGSRRVNRHLVSYGGRRYHAACANFWMAKALLKEARELIRNKDYEGALAMAQRALESDAGNYMALVMVGAAAQELPGRYETGIQALREAAAKNPEQPVAWQGLASLYDKVGDHLSLVEVYEKLLSLVGSDREKAVEYGMKLGRAHQKCGSLDDAVASLLAVLEPAKATGKQDSLWRALLDALKGQKSLNQEHRLLLEEVLAEVRDGDADELLYLETLKLNQKWDRASEQARAVIGKSPALGNRVLEAIAEGVVKGRISWDLSDFRDLPGEGWVALVKARKSFQECRFVEARSLAEEGLKTCRSSEGFLVLLEIQTRQCDWTAACESAQQCLQMDSACQTAILRAARAFLRLEKPNETQNMLQKLPSSSPEAEILEAKARLNLGDLEGTEKLLVGRTDVDASMLKIDIALDKSENVDDLLVRLESNHGSDRKALLFLGRHYLNRNETTEALKRLLQAAKADPFDMEVFLALGHAYRRTGTGAERAVKCYQKALSFNPTHEEAGVSLFDTLARDLKRVDEAERYVNGVCEARSPHEARWAWLRRVRFLPPSESVLIVQRLLRADPTSYILWNSLGDAYMWRGAYASALKAFGKSVELKENLYARYRTCHLKQKLSQLDEAVRDLRDLLAQHPGYLPALVALAESLLLLARKDTSKALDECAADKLQEAMEVLEKALERRKDLVCVWKTLAECLVLASRISSVRVPAWLSAKGEKRDLLLLAAKCLWKCISLAEGLASLWVDFGIVLCEACDSGGEFGEQAEAALRKSLVLDPRDWRAWNALGYLKTKSKNYPEAQHCYIQAIRCQSTNPVPWTNLGTLYLSTGEVVLANRAFSAAQAHEPSYPMCWAGQAFVARRVARDKALDVFRHCAAQLEFFPAGSLGYVHSVAEKLIDAQFRRTPDYQVEIVRLHAVAVACDAATRVVTRTPSSSCAWNLLGLMSERFGTLRHAASCFTKALELDPENDTVKRNLVRALVRAGRHEEAVNLAAGLDPADFHTRCWLALALHSHGKADESYAAYESALNLSSGSERGLALVAMGTTAYVSRGPEAAKGLLFQSSQTDDPPKEGLTALCALGILSSDALLASAALEELRVRGEGEDATAFEACLSVMRGDATRAVRTIAKAIHEHPDRSTLWKFLSLFLVRFRSGNARVAGRCAFVAAHLSPQDRRVLPLAALCHLMAGDGPGGLRIAQTALHLYPDDLKMWCTLLAAYHAVHRASRLPWAARLVKTLRRRKDVARPLSQWLACYERGIAMDLKA
ncbi:unnamed protein product [Darwinula stevensoni]|uniref:Synergin gamma C-terminal domain-containing protein n=1 Tax=Darwinula stevensoni TaxID=69355 RepID=A0A7R8XKD1_9CRUS|nr:unnamed protein product [Darwinula stevensoni]CAG0895085.1 unnamed protein product [Darwinula stevensoni]